MAKVSLMVTRIPEYPKWDLVSFSKLPTGRREALRTQFLGYIQVGLFYFQHGAKQEKAVNLHQGLLILGMAPLV